MTSAKSDYRLGRIVSAYLLGRNGKREIHPAVIISPDEEIIQPEAFDPRGGGGELRDNYVPGLGISSQYRKFNDPYVPLPANATTGLTRDCAVILNWYALLHVEDDFEWFIGDVPPELMYRINQAYRADLTARLGGMVGTIVQLLSRLQPRI